MRIPALYAQHGAAVQEEWDVGAELGGEPAEPVACEPDAPQCGKRTKRSRGVAAAAAQPGLHRNPFDDANGDAGHRTAASGSGPQAFGRAPHEIRRIGRTHWIGASDPELAGYGAERQRIVQRD